MELAFLRENVGNQTQVKNAINKDEKRSGTCEQKTQRMDLFTALQGLEISAP